MDSSGQVIPVDRYDSLFTAAPLVTWCPPSASATNSKGLLLSRFLIHLFIFCCFFHSGWVARLGGRGWERRGWERRGWGRRRWGGTFGHLIIMITYLHYHLPLVVVTRVYLCARARVCMKLKALREQWLLDGAPPAGTSDDARTRNLEETINR